MDVYSLLGLDNSKFTESLRHNQTLNIRKERYLNHMEQTFNNPPTNVLGAGITESNLANAIQQSGYPLQTIIANYLRSNFSVQDEWGYIDRDTKELRTIDIFAQRALYDIYEEQPLIRPSLNLMIECKQSELPYIFLLSPTQPWLLDFPIIAGLGQDEIQITTDDSASTWNYSPTHLLGLESHRFLHDPIYSYTLSKCLRKGKDLELSGGEPYNNLILPIIKSLLHFQIAEKPPKTAVYFDVHLALGIGVLNAPMVGVRVLDKSNELILLPWVRVVRHEYFENLELWKRSKCLVVDLVHKDFFQQYLEDHVSPFAKDFANLAILHKQEFITGKGFATSMDKDGWGNIEPRLRPRDIKANTARARLAFQNFLKLITGRKPQDEVSMANIGSR